MGKIGERLKKQRMLLDMSPEEFAAACGVGKSAQYRYESDERSPDGEYLAKAASLGVDLIYVVSGVTTFVEVKQQRAAYLPVDRVLQEIASLDLNDADAELLINLAKRLAEK